MYDYYSIDKNPTQIELFDTILSSLRLQDTNIDVIIKDGDKIKIDENHEFEVIHTPGHTAGHCCFYETNHKVAFLADIDLSNFGPWYAGSDSNLEDFEDSIKKMMMFDQDIVVTSHKGLISGNANIKKALKDYLNVIYARDDKILEELSESSPTQISDLENKNLIYKYYTEYDIYEKMAEKIMIGYHLNKLLKMGKIEKKDNKGFILN